MSALGRRFDCRIVLTSTNCDSKFVAKTFAPRVELYIDGLAHKCVLLVAKSPRRRLKFAK